MVKETLKCKSSLEIMHETTLAHLKNFGAIRHKKVKLHPQLLYRRKMIVFLLSRFFEFTLTDTEIEEDHVSFHGNQIALIPNWMVFLYNYTDGGLISTNDNRDKYGYVHFWFNSDSAALNFAHGMIDVIVDVTLAFIER